MNYVPTNGTDANSENDENMNREEFEVETISIESAKVFRQYGGIDVYFIIIFFIFSEKILVLF